MGRNCTSPRGRLVASMGLPSLPSTARLGRTRRLGCLGDRASVLRGNACQGKRGNLDKTTQPSMVPSLPGTMIRMPSSVMVAGPSGCGKTQLVDEMLTEQRVFQRTTARIVYRYGVWQSRFARMKKKGIRFYQGIPTPLTWENGSRVKGAIFWCWTISWKKGATTRACWIYSPKIPIIATSRCCI